MILRCHFLNSGEMRGFEVCEWKYESKGSHLVENNVKVRFALCTQSNPPAASVHVDHRSHKVVWPLFDDRSMCTLINHVEVRTEIKCYIHFYFEKYQTCVSLSNRFLSRIQIFSWR